MKTAFGNDASSELYGPDVPVRGRAGCRTIYEVDNPTGRGRITHYAVFPGIDLFYNDFHMSDGFNQNKLPRPDVIEINHCREGRFECRFATGGSCYLGPGDLAISSLSNRTLDTGFPLAHYHGISVVVALGEVGETVARMSDIVGKANIDPASFRRSLCPDESSCFIMRASDSIEHIFSELYTAPEQVREAYLRLKVAELFLYLGTVEPSKNEQSRRYFERVQVEAVSAARDFVIARLDQDVSLEELARRFGLSLTTLKSCFKAIYGMPVRAYVRSMRMKRGEELLRTTDLPVMDVAVRVGYSNPSKFGDAFRREMGMLPSAYRRVSHLGSPCLDGDLDTCCP